MAKFIDGQSGNPSGRPKGVKDKRILFADMLDVHKSQLFDRGLELALEGNEQMLRLFLDRLLPAKPKDNCLKYAVDLQGKASDKCSEVLDAISNGNITPSEGNSLLSSILMQMKVGEMDELRERIFEIDRILKNRGGL